MKQVPAAIEEFFIQFHGSRDWFECHEILEEYWKEHPGDTNSDSLVGLIQIAVGLYHERRGNKRGAVKMLRSSLSKLDLQRLEELGLDGEQLISIVRERVEKLERDAIEASVEANASLKALAFAFADLDLPYADSELEAHCRSLCEQRGWKWKAPSALEDEELIHRHTRRDRSDVVQAREESLKLRRQGHDRN